MVGLLINTVPVRAQLGAGTSVGEVLAQLDRDRIETLDHQHLGLMELHRLTGHDRLFDTVVVYENYPVEAAAELTAEGLSIGEANVRDYYHYPLVVQVIPGQRLRLLVQYNSEVFGAAAIESIMSRLQHVLNAISVNPTSTVGALTDFSTTVELQRNGADVGPIRQAGTHGPQHIRELLHAIFAENLGVDRLDGDESFFDHGGNSLTAIALRNAVNTALDRNVPLATIIKNPTINTLIEQL